MKKWELRKYLSPSDRLTEIIATIIMTMTIIIAIQFGIGISNYSVRLIFVATLGCNIAWGLVDAVNYIFSEVFERGQHLHFIKVIKEMKNEEEAVTFIGKKIETKLDSAILDQIQPEERVEISKRVFQHLSKSTSTTMKPKPVHIVQDDIYGAVSVFILVIIVCMILLLPFLFLPNNLVLGYRITQIISLILFFLVGYRLALVTNRPKVRTGLIFVVLGTIIIIIVIFMGG